MDQDVTWYHLGLPAQPMLGKQTNGCLELGHGFLATGLYGLVGMDHIWRDKAGHVAGGPLGLQPNWAGAQKLGVGAQLLRAKSNNTQHMFTEKCSKQCGGSMHASNLQNHFTRKHMCCKHAYSQSNKNAKHGKHAPCMEIVMCDLHMKANAWLHAAHEVLLQTTETIDFFAKLTI